VPMISPEETLCIPGCPATAPVHETIRHSQRNQAIITSAEPLQFHPHQLEAEQHLQSPVLSRSRFCDNSSSALD
jgi:hypothetical protein